MWGRGLSEPQHLLRFWGVRGSHPVCSPNQVRTGGNTSCVEIRSGKHVLVCDAGTGIIPFGECITQEKRIREVLLLLTHYHHDHICGIPHFRPFYLPDWRINIYGPQGAGGGIEHYLASQMRDPYFPVGIDEWLARIVYLPGEKTHFKHGPMRISRYTTHHPGLTYAYTIKLRNRRIVFCPDNECRFLERAVDRDLDDLTIEEGTLFTQMKQEQYQGSLTEVEGADIMIHDAQYTPEDYEMKKKWGHSCYVDTTNLAIDAKVKILYLFHHDPDYSDDKIGQIHESCLQIIRDRRSDLVCRVAREGDCINLDRP